MKASDVVSSNVPIYLDIILATPRHRSEVVLPVPGSHLHLSLDDLAGSPPIREAITCTATITRDLYAINKQAITGNIGMGSPSVVVLDYTTAPAGER